MKSITISVAETRDRGAVIYDVGPYLVDVYGQVWQDEVCIASEPKGIPLTPRVGERAWVIGYTIEGDL